MRIPGWIMLLSLTVMLILAGCGSSTNKSLLTGTVTNAGTRSGAAGEMVTLSTPGNTSGVTAISDSAGGFSYHNVSDGTYVLIISGPGIATTVFGPFQVARGAANIANVTVFPLTALPPGVAVPVNGTGTVAVNAIDSTGAAIASFNAQVGSLPVVAGTATTPAIFTNITPGTYPVTVTNTANGQTATIPAFIVGANSVTIVTVVLTTAVPTTGNFSVSGVVTNSGGAAVSGATARLLQNGTPVGAPTTTSGTGAYTLTNVAAGTYSVMVAGPNGITTIAGPVTVTNGNIANANVVVPATAELPSGITVPTNGTATVVALAFDATGAPIDPFTLQVGSTGPFTNPPGGPAVLQNIPPGTTNVIITNANNLASTVTFSNVVLAPNTVYVFRATLPSV